jgi:hypothetical protein
MARLQMCGVAPGSAAVGDVDACWQLAQRASWPNILGGRVARVGLALGRRLITA